MAIQRVVRKASVRAQIAGGIALLLVLAAPAWAWPMAWVAGPDGGGKSWGADTIFNVGGSQNYSNNGSIRVQLIESGAPANIFWPGDKPRLVIQVENLTGQRLTVRGQLDVIQYALRTPGKSTYDQEFIKLANAGSLPVSVDIPPKSFQNLDVVAPIPERFGGYGVVLALDNMPRVLAAIVCRVMKPPAAGTPQPFPKVMMDLGYVDVLTRLGTVQNRIMVSFTPPQAPNFKEFYAKLGDQLRALKAAGLSTTAEFGHGVWDGAQPMGKERKSPSGVADLCWLPEYDKDFTELVHRVCVEFGWPRGALVAVKLWNEPWEGGSVCHYGGSIPRYREMYLAMAKGVEQARKEVPGLLVLIGGCDSTSNTFDKLFCDGTDTFLPYLDFCSVHYQGMMVPAFNKKWMNRKVNGQPAPVKVWDTESWVANSDERIAPVLAAYYSVGYDRVVGTFADGVICGVEDMKVREGNGTRAMVLKRPWSVCVAVTAFSTLVGDRKFNRLLFPNGLPYVMVFDGLAGPDKQPNPNDGTVVVVGDLSRVFSTCLPFGNVKKPGGKMTLAAPDDSYSLYDNYGNRVATQDAQIVLPLNGDGFYLRANGQAGSFDKLLAALQAARVEGYEPLDIIAHDLLAPVTSKPALRLTLNNVLNRRITGKLSVSLGALTVEPAAQELTLEGNEVRDVVLAVSGPVSADNSYALKAAFDAGADGAAARDETLHVNLIAKRTIVVDGRLDDWNGVLGQPLSGGATAPTLTELNWNPGTKFPASLENGFALGYLSYDADNFYFAAKISDTTQDTAPWDYFGHNDASYFWPKDKWQAAGEPFSYWKAPDLPSGNYRAHDNVQLAFGALNADEKQFLPFAPGTRYGYGMVESVDYEFALNRSEVFCLQAPDMVEKNFYPKQPAGPRGGPVAKAQLVSRYEGNTRYVECAIPWSQMPEVKRAADAGQPVKFSFRVNDNAGPSCLELSRFRSVAERGNSFHVSWIEHWTNEVEFAFEK